MRSETCLYVSVHIPYGGVSSPVYRWQGVGSFKSYQLTKETSTTSWLWRRPVAYQAEFKRDFGDTPTVLVGLYCHADVLVARERSRTDWWDGLGVASLSVHDG